MVANIESVPVKHSIKKMNEIVHGGRSNGTEESILPFLDNCGATETHLFLSNSLGWGRKEVTKTWKRHKRSCFPGL